MRMRRAQRVSCVNLLPIHAILCLVQGAKAKGKVDSQQLLDLGSHAMPSMSKQVWPLVVDMPAPSSAACVHRTNRQTCAGMSSPQAPSAVVNKVAFGASVGTSAGVHKLSELALAGRATVDKVSQEARKVGWSALGVRVCKTQPVCEKWCACCMHAGQRPLGYALPEQAGVHRLLSCAGC